MQYNYVCIQRKRLGTADSTDIFVLKLGIGGRTLSHSLIRRPSPFPSTTFISVAAFFQGENKIKKKSFGTFFLFYPILVACGEFPDRGEKRLASPFDLLDSIAVDADDFVLQLQNSISVVTYEAKEEKGAASRARKNNILVVVLYLHALPTYIHNIYMRIRRKKRLVRVSALVCRWISERDSRRKKISSPQCP